MTANTARSGQVGTRRVFKPFGMSILVIGELLYHYLVCRSCYTICGHRFILKSFCFTFMAGKSKENDKIQLIKQAPDGFLLTGL